MSRAIPALAAALLLAGCGGPRHLDSASLRSEALGKRMRFTVLCPRSAEGARPGPDLHVVYLLHGYGGDERSLDEEGLSGRLLAAWEEGRLPPACLVMPDGERGFYLDWHDGSRRYEDYVVKEIIPAAEAHLGIAPGRERRHVVGVSMGGYGALLLGLGHPELFASAASISGVLFDEEKAIDLAGNRFLRWAIDIDRMLGDGTDAEFLARHNVYSLVDALPEGERPRLFLASGVGEPDALRRPSRLFHEHLAARGIAHEWRVYDGSHDWADWAPVIEEAIAFSAGGGGAP